MNKFILIIFNLIAFLTLPSILSASTGTTGVLLGVDAGCGNGHIESAETCDDRNTADNDGCSSVCVIESGWKCSGTPSQCISGGGSGGGGSSGGGGGSAIVFQIQNINIAPDINTAIINWTTNQDARCSTNWGLNFKANDYSLEGSAMQKKHSINLINLLDNTEYYFNIICENNLGNKAEILGSKFITASKDKSKDKQKPEDKGEKIDNIAPTNADNFTATYNKIQKIINLNWTNPKDVDFQGVKILRSEEFYPQDITDGIVIYNGTGQSAVDTNIIFGKTYYYTLFTYDNNGNYSSGAIALVVVPLQKERILKEIALPQLPRIEERLEEKIEQISEQNIDKDKDGLPDKNIDKDKDGLPDSWETEHSLNPFDPTDVDKDNDGDGLSNKDEYSRGTNLVNIDSDNDTMPDGWEVKYGLNPLDSNDADIDLDQGGLLNKEEYKLNTDPQDPYSAGEQIEADNIKYNIKPFIEYWTMENKVKLSSTRLDSALEQYQAYNVFPSTDFSIKIPKNKLPKNLKAVLLTLKSKEDNTMKEYLLQFDKSRKYFTTKIQTPSNFGQYDISITIIDLNNKKILQTQELLNVVNFGKIIKIDFKKHWLYKVLAAEQNNLALTALDPVNSAQITLYQVNGSVVEKWPGYQFNQTNPINSNQAGQYGFSVPNGRYFLEVTKEHFYPFQTAVFEVGNNIVNKDIELIYIPKINYIKIIIIALILILVYIFIRKVKRDKQLAVENIIDNNK